VGFAAKMDPVNPNEFSLYKRGAPVAIGTSRDQAILDDIIVVYPVSMSLQDKFSSTLLSMLG
jgi:hypothetical protein